MGGWVGHKLLTQQALAHLIRNNFICLISRWACPWGLREVNESRGDGGQLGLEPGSVPGSLTSSYWIRGLTLRCVCILSHLAAEETGARKYSVTDLRAHS